MPTRDFIESVRERAQVDPEFGKALLREAVSCVLNGEPRIGRILLHDYADAVIGFEKLSRKTGESRESLDRILSRNGAPRADELLAIIAAIAEHEDVEFDVQAVHRGRAEQLVAD